MVSNNGSCFCCFWFAYWSRVCHRCCSPYLHYMVHRDSCILLYLQFYILLLLLLLLLACVLLVCILEPSLHGHRCCIPYLCNMTYVSGFTHPPSPSILYTVVFVNFVVGVRAFGLHTGAEYAPPPVLHSISPQ